MDENRIKKTEALKLVRKRLKEMLKPLGFVTHPRSKVCLVRVRGELIDVVGLRTDGCHLEPSISVYYAPAPFESADLDVIRLWSFMEEKENITTRLMWECIITENGYYYETEHFETVWQEIAFTLEQYVLPCMELLTVERFLSFMIMDSRQKEDFFHVHQTVFFSDSYFQCMSAAAVYGVGMWRLGYYDEGLPYVIFAQNKYRHWMTGREQETDYFHVCKARALQKMDELVSAFERRPESFGTIVRELTDQICENWADYMD